jgi:hypothetical protein
MKNLIKLLVVVILLTMSTGTFAQSKFRFGAKAGLNLAGMLVKDNDQDISKDFKLKMGLNIGGLVEYAFTEKFVLESGLSFSMKGHKFDKAGLKYNYNLNYIELPINAAYKISLGNIKIAIKAGPYFGFALSGKMKSKDKIFMAPDGSLTDELKINIGTDKDKDDLKPLEIGFNFGAGIEFNGMLFGAQYGLGLANLSPDTGNGAKVKNKVIGIYVGYLFGGKK